MDEVGFKLTNITVSPDKLKVRTFGNISISFSLNQFLPIHSVLVIRIRGGRNNKNDWYYLQTYDENRNGYVHLKTDPPAKSTPIMIAGKELSVQYLVTDKKGIRPDTKFQLNIKNTLVQSLAENKKKFEILIKLPSKEKVLVESIPTINIVSNELDHFSVICPSTVYKNEKFKILVRVEDKFFNLIEEFANKLRLIEISESKLENEIGFVEFKRENGGLSWFSDYSFKTQGIYQIAVVHKNKYYYSNPIICSNKSEGENLYWGYIHGHTNKSDGIRDTEEYFNNLINAGLEFGTTTEHDHKWETSDDDYEDVKVLVKKFNSRDFVSFFGYEYGYWYTGYGDICIYHYDNNIPIMRSDINKYNSTNKLIKNLKKYEGKVLMIAHHTALRPGYRNWDSFDNSIERLVEIYSSWGNQEYSAKDGNPIPPRYKFFGYGKFARKRGPILEKKGSFVQDALARGYKLGFTAGGDDHIGLYPSGPLDPDNGIYPPGIMAVWAKNLTKESIWDALMNRRCYGSTGPRIIVKFKINSYIMGEVVNIDTDSPNQHERKIVANLISPIKILRIEVVRNNKVIESTNFNHYKVDFKYSDTELFDDISTLHVNKEEKFVFYYIRIFLENQNMAWASPIWFVHTL